MIYRVTIHMHHLDGTLVRPGWNIRTTPPALGDEPPANDVAEALWHSIDEEAIACTPNAVLIDEVVVTEEVVAPAVGTAGSHTVNQAGGMDLGVSPNIPFGLVAITDLHTATRSRSSRGHFAWASPGIHNHVDGNEFSADYLALLDDLAQDVIQIFGMGIGIGATTVTPCVYSRTRASRDTPPTFFDLTSATVNPKCHWLRSRMTNP